MPVTRTSNKTAVHTNLCHKTKHLFTQICATKQNRCVTQICATKQNSYSHKFVPPNKTVVHTNLLHKTKQLFTQICGKKQNSCSHKFVAQNKTAVHTNLCHKSKQMFTQICATKYQTYLENQLNNFCTSNNSMLMKYHTGVLENDKNYMSTVRGGMCLVLGVLLH
jgi:hypothetical protein